MQPEKIDLSTATISEDKLAQLRDLLPEVFHEGKINFDELKNALGEYVEEDPANERFGLRWPGKSRLQQVINTPSVGTLVPQPEESVDWDTTGNIIIEGDNLEVLKLLQKSYAGKVKMIYIDPPYNTGNDFVYPDKYASGLDTYLEFTGQKDENGQKLASNSDTSGRYHANWLNMMYPRLYLARNLLRQDGLLFISIDDAEFANLHHALVSVLGEENHMATLMWEARNSISNDQQFSHNHNYILVWARSREYASMVGDPLDSDEYSNPDNDPRGPWKPVPLDANKPGGDTKYPITNPNTQEKFWPPASRSWAINPSAYDSLLQDGRISFGATGKSAPKRKLFLSERLERGDSKTPSTILRGVSTNTHATKELDSLFGDRIFQYPKPVNLVQRFVSYSTLSSQESLVLDFFAGSGTTGHAVMKQNAEDGGNRKYILVQLPEPMEPKTLDDGTQLNTIADIARERVRRAGKKIADEYKGSSRDSSPTAQNDGGLDIGFRAYRLAPSNFQPWDGDNTDSGMMTSARQASFMPQTQQLSLEERILQAADHLNPAADDIAILTELLLKLGEELTVPVEQLTLAGKLVYDINGNARLICLEREITLDVIREMAAREPLEIICLDAGFPDDQAKVNAGQIIATQAQHIEGAIAFKVV